MSDSVVKQGMPWWKFLGNRFLTAFENRVLGLQLSEYHTGYRAFSRKVLEQVPFLLNSDKFVFDQEMLVQAVHLGFRIAEVPVPTRYFAEASSASFIARVLWPKHFAIAFALPHAQDCDLRATPTSKLLGPIFAG